MNTFSFGSDLMQYLTLWDSHEKGWNSLQKWCSGSVTNCGWRAKKVNQNLWKKCYFCLTLFWSETVGYENGLYHPLSRKFKYMHAIQFFHGHYLTTLTYLNTTNWNNFASLSENLSKYALLVLRLTGRWEEN